MVCPTRWIGSNPAPEGLFQDTACREGDGVASPCAGHLDAQRQAAPVEAGAPSSNGRRSLFNTHRADFEDVPVYARDSLTPGMRLTGPAVVCESQTSTVVARGFDARIDGQGYIILERNHESA